MNMELDMTSDDIMYNVVVNTSSDKEHVSNI